MAYYPTPTNNDTQDLTSFFQFVSVISDGFFFPIILFALWIIMFMALKQFRTSIAWTTSSFIMAMMSIPLVIIEVLSPYYMYLLFILTAIGAVWLKLEQ